MLIGYMRVSTGEQNLDLQRDALDRAGCNRIFDDVCSGRTTERPGLDKAIDIMRDGDALVVWKLDRIGRSLPHVVGLVGDLQKRGVGLKVLTGDIDTTTVTGRLVFGIFATLAVRARPDPRAHDGRAGCGQGPWPRGRAATGDDETEVEGRNGVDGRPRQCRARRRCPARSIGVDTLCLCRRQRTAARAGQRTVGQARDQIRGSGIA